jgi:hypothetical protein
MAAAVVAAPRRWRAAAAAQPVRAAAQVWGGASLGASAELRRVLVEAAESARPRKAVPRAAVGISVQAAGRPGLRGGWWGPRRSSQSGPAAASAIA